MDRYTYDHVLKTPGHPIYSLAFFLSSNKGRGSRGVWEFLYRWCHESILFSVHQLHYLFIPQYTGSWENRVQEIHGISGVELSRVLSLLLNARY